MPHELREVRIGMSKLAVERVLGEADYSPAPGLFYFSTGGDCPLDDMGREASCGVVAEFHVEPTSGINGTLHSCTWGAIGE